MCTFDVFASFQQAGARKVYAVEASSMAAHAKASESFVWHKIQLSFPFGKVSHL